MILARSILFVLTALVLIVFYVPLGHADYTGRWGDGTYGIATASGFAAPLEAVARSSPAWNAGVRPGDRIDRAWVGSEYLRVQNPHAGERRSFHFVRPDGTHYAVTLTATAVPGFAVWDRLTGILAIVPATVFLAVAFALVFLRPNVMTWSFYAYAVGYFSTAPSFEFFGTIFTPDQMRLLSFPLTTFAGNFAVLPLLPFVLRFPDNRLSGVRRRFDVASWVFLGVAFLAYSYDWYIRWSVGRLVPFVGVLDTWLPLSVFVIAALIVIKKYTASPAANRQRFGFLVVGLIVSFVAYAIYFVPGVSRPVAQIAGYAVVIMPISVAYAVMRHRVLDINFVLNRAIVYGLVSLFVITVVSLLDWFFGQIVSRQHLALFGELLATIAVGLLLDRINKFIGRIVETVFFRSRRIAERYLRRAAQALPYATEESAVTDGLVQVPVDALALNAAALYRRSADDRRFEGVGTATGTAIAPSGFDQNHLLVRMLEADEACVWLDELRTHLDHDNAAIYALAVPVTVRHELVSFTLYGAHRNGAQIDPDEVDLLLELAREASRAYDHIEAVRTRERYARFSMPAPETA